ncbi:hypothetical protein EJA00_04840 [Streptococcus suis]|uniref:Uncharacterized protein n=1 Tax=Streptococcus suis TaxID=1307 RepID=A0A426T5C6_STRSU|nr:hypothetical protein EI219_04620 [Streptococcus suis]RRR49147.1 hypothetical protein EJA00_04840 [Streptococcus suis]
MGLTVQCTVKGWRQDLRSKSQQFVFYTPNLTITTVANKVRSISNLQRFPEPLELCGGGSLKGLGDLLKWEI